MAQRSPLVTAALIAGGVLGVAVVGLAVAVFTAPSAYTVERTARIEATPEAVWPHVADYRAFVAWSPWTDRDPAQTSTFSEPSEGVGARYAWAGNADVGRGEMETLTADPPRRMTQRLSFVEPFESAADVEFVLAPHGAATDVTWRMRGEHDLMGRAFSLFMDFDAMIGPDFDEGLRRLRARVEQAEAERLAAQAARPPEDAPDSPINTRETTESGVTIAGRTSTAYHLHAGPPARVGGASFKVDNGSDAAKVIRVAKVEILHDRTCEAPPTTVLAEPASGGLFASALEMRESAPELSIDPGASLVVDAGFAVVEAAQVSCDAYAARVTFDVSGEAATVVAAIEVVRRNAAE
jgi:hypothetical protein